LLADYPCAWFPPSLAKKKEIAIISWKKVLHDLTALPFKLERLLEDPDRLVRMKANALRFAKPTASTTIVDALLEDRLPPLSFTKDQRAAIALAARPE
jgi:processive 1,2-diacylglycerol beta-glucosyltransferase